MAGKRKDPKRVAAGKKAWANRSKSSRNRSGGSRKKSNGRKPIQRGWTGRIGAFVMGAVPCTIAGVETAQVTQRIYKEQNLSILGAAYFGLIRFVNNLGNGIIGVEPFDKTMAFAKKDGGVVRIKTESGLPKGSLLSVIGTGLAMLGVDWIASKLAGGRPIKIPFTNYNATGGS